MIRSLAGRYPRGSDPRRGADCVSCGDVWLTAIECFGALVIPQNLHQRSVYSDFVSVHYSSVRADCLQAPPGPWLFS
ncbi:hypothetical protein C0Q70_00357 [Pomacea canaliculata]|uniref:Uncharacterized protein n=1 Tax=Pomacea canaliculata TaxID=400727 RepID=A0A2T7PWE6_POMCA|nr:hypothetical protein C0Q70_00357 [Pomacea canaliculata]